MKRVLLYICIALATIGCTQDADVTSSSNNAVTITSNITTRVIDSQWESSDDIGVYMSSSDFGDEGSNVLYTTTSGNGVFSSNTPLYYPQSGVVSIFAYYPYVSDVDITAYSVDSNNQQVDLLSAVQSNITSSSSVVELTFEHLLSKISLTIKAGEGLTEADLSNLEVKISNISTTATFDITSNSANNLGAANNLSLTTATDGTSFEAIVIPQTLDNATFDFTTENHGFFSATISTTAFVSNSEYSYTATLNRDGVELTEANIDTWVENTETSATDVVDIKYGSDGVYYINTGAGLKAFADLVNGVENTTAVTLGEVNFSTTPQPNIDGVLTTNVDLSDISWTPIGSSANKYSGTFEGGGCKVRNLYINSSSDYQALFGYVSGATIQNLDVSGSVNGAMYVGGVVGAAYSNTTLTSCYNNASVTGSSDNVGGVAGYTSGSTISKSYNTGDVTGAANVGGIVGQSLSLVISCYNTGAIKNSGGDNTGGITGYANGNTVFNCYNIGTITGYSYNSGGIVGSTSANSVISACYSGSTYVVNAQNSSDSSVGGISGSAEATVSDCYYDSTIINSQVKGAVANSDGDTYYGFTTTEIQSDGFVVTLNNAAYAYNQTYPAISACAWVQVLGDYPLLDFDSTPSYTGDPDIELRIEYDQMRYYINTGAGLKAFADLINGEVNTTAITLGNITFSTTPQTVIYGYLTKDVDLSDVCYYVDGTPENDVSWTPIGNCTTSSVYSSSIYFYGLFDGCGYEIKNLYINSTSNFQGLFGYVYNPSFIKNVGIVESSVSGAGYVGALVGYAYGSADISNCYNSGSVSGTGKYIGGLVGCSESGIDITNCYNTGDVTGDSDSYTSSTWYIGGVVGSNSNSSTVTMCYNTGDVKASSYQYVGGVVGRNEVSSTISLCYNKGDVTGYMYTGGVAGYNYSYSISNCYNTGNIKGEDYYVGGITGTAHPFSADYTCVTTNCYSSGSVSSKTDTYIGGIIGFYYFYSSPIVTYCYYDKDTVDDEIDETYIYAPANAMYKTTLHSSYEEEETTYWGFSTTEMQDGTLYDYLNTGDGADCWVDVTNGYPILSWQVEE